MTGACSGYGPGYRTANGDFDSVTPCSETVTDLTNLPLIDAVVRQILTDHVLPGRPV